MINGIPWYSLAPFVAVIMISAGLILYRVGRPTATRHTTTARNPTRKAGMGR